MGAPITVETHVRTSSVRFTWEELKYALIREAMDASGIKSLGPTDKAKITLRQLTEGSPAYLVERWEATIEIVKDLSGDE